MAASGIYAYVTGGYTGLPADSEGIVSLIPASDSAVSVPQVAEVTAYVRGGAIYQDAKYSFDGAAVLAPGDAVYQYAVVPYVRTTEGVPAASLPVRVISVSAGTIVRLGDAPELRDGSNVSVTAETFSRDKWGSPSSSAPSPNPAPTGVDEAAVRRIAQEAVASALANHPAGSGITEARAQAIVDAAIAGIPQGMTAEAIRQLVVASTAVQVKKAVDELPRTPGGGARITDNLDGTISIGS